MTNLLLSNFQAPGDIVMLTAAVRDLHLNYPGQFLTDIRSSCPEIWENNPFLHPLSEADPGLVSLKCEYPLIHSSNGLPYHFIHGFIQFLNDRLNLHIRPTAFKGDIYMTDAERNANSQVKDASGEDRAYWIIVSGGKFDFTAKWWDPERYQEVVNFFKGKIQFVQVGDLNHNHPPLENVLDLRGATSLRQLINLVYHADGVLTPVSLLMHLAAAVPIKPGKPPLRPCVVVAGGREGSQWEAYPNHQFIHTIGALPCCASGGCWRSRVLPLGDGDDKDLPENLCLNPVGFIPKCLDMITSEEVIRRINIYYDGGILG